MSKRTEKENDEELRPEYDAVLIKSGVRGKYAERYCSGTNLALLAPDVVEAFPSDEAVNEALRMLMKVANASVEKPRRRRPRAKAKHGM